MQLGLNAQLYTYQVYCHYNYNIYNARSYSRVAQLMLITVLSAVAT